MGRITLWFGSHSCSWRHKPTKRHRLRHLKTDAQAVCRPSSRQTTTQEDTRTGQLEVDGKAHILNYFAKTLRDTKLAPKFPMDELATQTADLSGSDLKELCRNAVMTPVREYLRSQGGNTAMLEKGHSEVCAHKLMFCSPLNLNRDTI